MFTVVLPISGAPKAGMGQFMDNAPDVGKKIYDSEQFHVCAARVS